MLATRWGHPHIVDEDGIVLNHYDYDAWGNLTAQEEVFPNHFKFTGQHDPATQQYYLHARFYNPIIACFTQANTYRGDGLNLYAYCTNRPTHHIDSTSHWCGKKKDVFNQLATEASNSVKDQNRISNGTAQNIFLHCQKPHLRPISLVKLPLRP